jgi:hypothetical protein
MHDRVVDGLGADHADAAHPARIVIRHDVLALDRMDQRRLEPVRERAQLFRGAVASGAAHDDDAAGRIDAAGDIGDVRVARHDLGPRLQGRDARDFAVGLGADDILRQRQMGDAAAGIGGRNRLMNDGRRLRRRKWFRIERDVAEQQIGLGGLDEVGAVHLARHVARERQDRRVVAARFIEAGDQMRAAGAGGAGADREPAGKLGLAGGGKRRAFLVADADPFDVAAANRVGERIERVADQSENVLDPDLLEHADQYVRDRLGHLRLLNFPASRVRSVDQNSVTAECKSRAAPRSSPMVYQPALGRRSLPRRVGLKPVPKRDAFGFACRPP